MRQTWIVLLLACLLSACGPHFKNEAEEQRYLESLSNPTVEQFRRREELQQKRIEELDERRVDIFEWL